MAGSDASTRRDHTLVVVHVPKTAGTALRVGLEAAFGDRLVTDYDDAPLQHPAWVRRGRALRDAVRHAGRPLHADCVYGHFLACKYSLAIRTRYVTWLRDPVQRVVSRYHHYRRAMLAGEQAHARWGLVPGLDLETFVRLPQYRDTCAEYFWAFPLRRFSFIGLVERFDSDLARFHARFGIPHAVAAARVNANPDKQGVAYEVEPRIDSLIRKLNPRDDRLYQSLLDRG